MKVQQSRLLRHPPRQTLPSLQLSTFVHPLGHPLLNLKPGPLSCLSTGNAPRKSGFFLRIHPSPRNLSLNILFVPQEFHQLLSFNHLLVTKAQLTYNTIMNQKRTLVIKFSSSQDYISCREFKHHSNKVRGHK